MRLSTSFILGFLPLLSNAYEICTCDAGSSGVSQNGFNQILNGLNLNSHDEFCVNAPDYDGCYDKKVATKGTGDFYGCGIFCADADNSGACLFTWAYTAWLGGNTGGCIKKSDLINVVEAMAQDAEQYDTVNSGTSEMDGGGFRVYVQAGFSVTGGQCDPGSCI